MMRIRFLFMAMLALLVASSSPLTAGRRIRESKFPKLANRCQKGKEKACRILLDEALNDTNLSSSAVRWIDDQAMLRQVALEGTVPSGRQAATGKIADPAILTRVALNDPVSSVREAAVSHLADQPLLLKVALESDDGSSRSDAADKITEQPLLLKLALESKQSALRSGAASRIKDQKLLATLAVDSSDSGIRSAAVSKLTDQSVLAKVAMTDTDAHVGAAAASRLTSQAVLAEVALRDKKAEVRSAAVSKLTDQSVLAKVAMTDTDARVGAAAAKRLTGQDQLRTVVLKSTDPAVRAAVVGKLADQAFLARLAENDKSLEIRQQAVTRITDQAALLEVAMTQNSPVVQKEALGRIDSPAELAKIVSLPKNGDSLLWLRAEALGTSKAFDEYVTYMPGGTHLREAKTASLAAARVVQEFRTALAKGDKQALRALYRQNPNAVPVKELKGTVVGYLHLTDIGLSGIAVTIVGHPGFGAEVTVEQAVKSGLVTREPRRGKLRTDLETVTGGKYWLGADGMLHSDLTVRGGYFGVHTNTGRTNAIVRYVVLPSGKRLILDIR